MKRFFTLLLATYCLTAVGQCDADYDFGEADWGISPDPALGEVLSTASLNKPYSGSLHLLVPNLMDQVDDNFPSGLFVEQLEIASDGMIDSGMLSGVVFKDLATLEQFHAGDLGLAFVPNNAGDNANPSVFLPGGQYCAAIEGIPTRQGVYELKMDMIFTATAGGSLFLPYRIEGIVLSIQGVEPECGSDLNNNGICDLEELGNATSGGLCGQGTVWDETSQTCIPDNPSDLNYDGCVDVNDFMGHLATFGSGCEEGVAETPWQCGDPLEYQGYDYETVQIGEQCWFAENLRAEHYRNGDAIPSGLSDSEWENTTSGAVAVYGEGNGTCDNYSPDGDACDELWSLNEYGRLYNWFAVDDVRVLCPSDWYVPSNNDWSTLTNYLDGSLVAGDVLKSTSGWYNDGGGTNYSGFSALPGGGRSNTGTSVVAGLVGYWWTSTTYGSLANNRSLSAGYDAFSVDTQFRSFGHSIRCIKDTE